jgi:hypothetical protein
MNALGNAEFLSSLAVPAMVPLPPWADAAVTKTVLRSITDTISRVLFKLKIMTNPFVTNFVNSYDLKNRTLDGE